MDDLREKSLLVIGVGNWYRSDDGVGLVVARRLKAMNLPGIVVCEESGEGMALMEAWVNAEHVAVIDAALSGSPPGTIHKLHADSMTIPYSFFHYSSHAFSVAEAVELARVLNSLPPRLTLYGIEGKNFGAGVGLTPEVDQAAGDVVKEVIHTVATPASA